MSRSSSPDDLEAIAAMEAKIARAKEKIRLKQLEEERRRDSNPKVLVADSPSPRKKRQKMDAERDSTLNSRPAYFDSTLLGPPPPLSFSNNHIFKPEGSVSITRERDRREESKFSSHESALPKSFMEKLQAEQEAAKAEQIRRDRNSQRSTGFNLTGTAKSSSTRSNVKEKVDVDALLKARSGTDMKVKAKIKDSSTSSRKGKEREAMDDALMGRDVKPIVPAMTRPKASDSRKEKEDVVPRRRKRSPSPNRDQDDRDQSDDSLGITDGPSGDQKKKRRNKDGTVIEELEMGPIEFDPPRNDPHFRKIEPNSGIKLRERIIPHEQVQGLLSDRYHLTPSQIYSLARIDNRRQVHIDVDADFVVIGVLAWKDETRFLNSNPLAEPRKESEAQKKRRQSQKADPLMKEALPEDAKPETELFLTRTKKQRKQRYIRFELVDLSTEQSAASGTGQLHVMLVEADSVDTGFDEDGTEVPIYKGQSGGAYEKYWKESPGAVVAIINPSFLPHSEGRPHTLKPISADSMVVLGRAKDLTFCDAIRKKDRQKCNSWVDARVGTKCQFHVHSAVNRTGMGRAETFGNTASLKQTTSISFSKLTNSLKTSHAGAAPGAKKKPLPLDASTSVMVAGHNTYIAGGSRTGPVSGPGGGTRARTADLSALTAGGIGLPVSRGSGGFIPGVRDGPVVSEEVKKKEREKLDRQRGRRELRELGKMDRGASVGGEYLRLARMHDKAKKAKEREREEKEAQKEGGRSKKKSKRDESSDESSDEAEGDDGEKGKSGKERKKIFSSEAVRMIGYNPSHKPGDVKMEMNDDEELLAQRLALEGGVRQAIKLTAPAGRRVVSGVDIDPDTVAKRKKANSKAPRASAASRAIPEKLHDAPARDDDDDDDDDDLLIEGAPAEAIKLPVPPPRFPSNTSQLSRTLSTAPDEAGE